jgi:hypothetical protein
MCFFLHENTRPQTNSLHTALNSLFREEKFMQGFDWKARRKAKM